VLDPGVYNNLSLSPDERRLAVAIDTGSPPNRDVWIVDLARGVPTRLTFDPGSDGGGAWSSEGTRIALTSNRGGPFAIFTLSSTLPGTEKQLFDSKTSTYAPSWSADGRHLAFSNLSSSATGWDLWILPMERRSGAVPVRADPGAGRQRRVFPGRPVDRVLVNRVESRGVYVRPFPGPGGQYQVSRAGGTQPQWRGDGRELFFLGLDAVLMATTVGGTQQSFEAGIPEALFETSVALAANQNRRQYAAAKDGKRFLVNLPYRGARAPAGDRRAELAGRDQAIATGELLGRDLQIREVAFGPGSDPQGHSAFPRLQLQIVDDEAWLLGAMHEESRAAGRSPRSCTSSRRRVRGRRTTRTFSGASCRDRAKSNVGCALYWVE
jgi:hypothetical protein